MITCKNCGYVGSYLGKRCPECGKEFFLTDAEIDAQLELLSEVTEKREYEAMAESYHILADAGVTTAQREYGRILEKGELTDRDLDGAMTYFYSAALKNDPYSAYRYSRLVYRNSSEAGRFWLLYSAVIGCKEAYMEVAELFSELGLEQDANYFYYLVALTGRSDAIATLAERYYRGIGTSPSPEAAKWYLDKLKVPPIYAIKLAYSLRGVAKAEPPAPKPKNYNGLLKRMSYQAQQCGFDTAALRINEILAERGDSEAMLYTGRARVKGIGCSPDPKRGISMISKAAAHGSVEAFLTLGDLYAEGKVIEGSMQRAIANYRRAGELGSAEAFEFLGDIYYNGGQVDRSIPDALRYYENAARIGSDRASAKAKLILKKRQEAYDTAILPSTTPIEKFKLFALSAQMGYIPAQRRLAECFERGTGTAKNRRGAFIWYKKAAEMGDSLSVYKLGKCYSDGIGTRRDYDIARKLFTLAKSGGDERAAEELKVMLDRRLRTVSQRHYSKAMRLIHKGCFSDAMMELSIASDLMHPKAIYTVGCMYEFGIGAACDKDKAFEIYEEAYALKFRDPRALYKLAVLKMLRSKN